jgi:hypothetical protein
MINYIHFIRLSNLFIPIIRFVKQKFNLSRPSFHPNCRCIIIPINERIKHDSKKESNASENAIEKDCT